ncbi:MAG: methyl-accepting chemotaxis protein, partial [Candidatus Nanopelagicales bacterium]
MLRLGSRVIALSLSLLLLATGGVLLWQGTRDADQQSEALDRDLTSAGEASAVLLAEQFERAVAADIQLSSVPAFTRFYQRPGSITHKIQDYGRLQRDMQQTLRSIETVFPGAVSEACFIDVATGRELARIVDGRAAPYKELSADESGASFFTPASEQPNGIPYQVQPYLSEDSGLWVIATATPIFLHGEAQAIVHFETSIESLRLSGLAASSHSIRVIDNETGNVVVDNQFEQPAGGKLGVPSDQTFADLTRQDVASGLVTLGDKRVAYSPIAHTRLDARNDNDWTVAASDPIVDVGWTHSFTAWIAALFALGIPLLIASILAFAWDRRKQRQEQERVSEERDELDARMNDLSEALARAAAGDLDVTFAVDLGDERMTALAHGFDATLTHLRGLVLQAQASGEKLARSAGELRVSASQQAHSAAEQSTTVMQTTATVEELAATAAQIADTASDVAISAHQTLELTEEGLTAVRDSVAAMDRITDKVGLIAGSSTSLGEKVNEIGRILALIDELSEQTNLLALNAAIEAARAGEHGRGFAVVAAEVRKLAERAQQSTAQIQGLVTEIKSHTQTTVLASQEG